MYNPFLAHSLYRNMQRAGICLRLWLAYLDLACSRGNRGQGGTTPAICGAEWRGRFLWVTAPWIHSVGRAMPGEDQSQAL